MNGVSITSMLTLCHRVYVEKHIFNIYLLIARDHRVHHKYSETDADPHNSNRGFFFAHVGWLLVRKHPEVIKKGRLIGMDDLMQDPVVRFQRKYVFLVYCKFSMR